MDWIVAGLTGTLLLLGAVSGTSAFRRWLRSLRARREYLTGTDRIPLVFPVEPRTEAEGYGAPPEVKLELATPLAAVAAGPAIDRDSPAPSRTAAAPRLDFEVPISWEDDEPASTPIAAAPPPPSDTRRTPVANDPVPFRPDDRTMRLLPGRLEIEDGEEGRAEIRFVDLPGDRPEITFGRRPGEPFRHVQLQSPTVSRDHARMVRENGAWVIHNVSQTNPIVVNGERLTGSEGHALSNGDRIEMGEVVFRYRQP